MYIYVHKNTLQLEIYRFILFKHQSNNCLSETAEKKIKRLNCCTVTYLICQYERLVGVYNLHSSNIYLNYQRKAIQEYEESTSSFHINLSTDCTYWKFGVRRRT